MKKNVLKKLICTVLTAVCVITSVVPTFAEDIITTTEAATTKSVTSAYKYHLEGYDKKGNDLLFSKTSFYKDLNSIPSIGTGKTTINVPAVTNKVKSVSAEKNKSVYESYVKFKAPKTGTYVFTLTNLNGTDKNALRAMSDFDIFTPLKDGKKYRLNHVDCYTVGEYDLLWENNYMEKLHAMREAYETEHPDYAHYLEKDVWDKQNIADNFPTNMIKYTVKLKKGQTYVYVVDNSGMTTFDEPRRNDYYNLNSYSCVYGGNYTAAYSFDMEIKLKTKK